MVNSKHTAPTHTPNIIDVVAPRCKVLDVLLPYKEEIDLPTLEALLS